MNQNAKTNEFEKVLLEHTEMCYTVALAMTQNRKEARRLTYDVLSWAWQFHTIAGEHTRIKAKLLDELRRRHIQDRAQLAFGVPSAAAVAENV